MDTIRLAIIGCGAISEKHGQALSRIEGARLAAVVDVQQDRAKAFAAKYAKGGSAVGAAGGAGCASESAAGASTACVGSSDVLITTDYHSILRSPDIDAVIIAAPSGLHAKIGADVVEASKHVLIEKPLTLSTADARGLIEKANANHVHIGTVHPNRHYPTSQMIHSAIRDGRLGKLSHVVATLRWNRTQAYYDEAPWRKTRSMDGGVLFNQAWHAIDMMLWLAGSPVAEVQGMSARRLHDIETEDIVLATIRFADGTLGQIEATTNAYPKNLEQTVSVFGGTGTVVLGGGRAEAIRVWRVAGDDEKQVLAQWSEATAPKQDASWPHEQCIRAFLKAVQTGQTGPSEDVLTAIEAIGLIERVLGLA